MENKNKNSLAVSVTVLPRKATLKKESLYEEFVLWSAMTYGEQKQFGAENSQDFAKKHNVSDRTLRRWRTQPDFKARVREIRDTWGFGKTSNVLNSIYRTAIKGNPLSQSLWLQYFEGFNPRGKEEDKNKTKVEFSVNDIRFLIEQLPDDKKKKHYGYLTELLEDVDTIKLARDVEIEFEDSSSGERLEGEVLAEANHDAQSLPDEKADVLAIRHTQCLCEDLERKVSACNYQSTERWWKE